MVFKMPVSPTIQMQQEPPVVKLYQGGISIE